MNTDAAECDRVAGNSSINSTIHSCFRVITPDDEQKFRTKFRHQDGDNESLLHTFRELLVGGYLSDHGFVMKYEPVIEGKTPDWAILDKDSAEYRGIVEVSNFHAGHATDKDIDRQIEQRGCATLFLPDNDSRLYGHIQDKAAGYKRLVEKLNIPYIIALFGEFNADVELEEISRCMSESQTALFNLYPAVSGVLFFMEQVGVYRFSYLANANATWQLPVSNGYFPGNGEARLKPA